MLETLRNQDLAYTELYNKVVAVGYKYIPHYFLMVHMCNKGYNIYDRYCMFPTRQITCHVGIDGQI